MQTYIVDIDVRVSYSANPTGWIVESVNFEMEDDEKVIDQAYTLIQTYDQNGVEIYHWHVALEVQARNNPLGWIHDTINIQLDEGEEVEVNVRTKDQTIEL
jgi:hypothetical protein